MKIILVGTAMFSLGLAACTVNPLTQVTKSEQSSATSVAPVFHARLDDANTALVVSNIVFALTQLAELSPIQTTLQIKTPDTSIGKVVMAELAEAGYGLQLVDSDIGPNYVRYKFEESATESGLITRFSLVIGEIEATRDYAIKQNTVLPDSALSIAGAADVFVELNDAIFEEKGSNYRADVVFTDTSQPEYQGPTLMTELAVGRNGGVLRASGSEVSATQVSVIKKNLYNTHESNYAALFDAYEDVESTVLVFSNDSMVLGAKNKNIVADFARKMNPDTDLVSVIGCSHGRTDITNGNSVLAIGRANRVKEAFVYAGVDYGKVLDEGCWAPTYFDAVMPRRGVVLTLKRLKEVGRSG